MPRLPTAEQSRLSEIRDEVFSWRRWGPYISERSWATVREDYSPNGRAWDFLPHDLARSKAYRWGEDAIAGWCDRYQVLCFAPAFWNGRDPIIKERLFGLTPDEGNHGEDVKEYYFHLDNTPTHSYAKYLYKYPQAEYPYRRLIEENQRRNGCGPEFELLDTGLFDRNEYFDIFIEYAKIDAEDWCVRIEAINRGPRPAPLHVLPHLWFRNTWSWHEPAKPRPTIRFGPRGRGFLSLRADESAGTTLSNLPIEYTLGPRVLYAAEAPAWFTENETNLPRVFGPKFEDDAKFVKDAFHRHLILGRDSINPGQVGSKAALHYHFKAIEPGGSAVVRLRLSPKMDLADPIDHVDAWVERRRIEADEFYATVHPIGASAEERRVQRQALAGLLWSKQSYIFDVNRWLTGDFPSSPPPATRTRNQHWRHLNSMRVMSMPDKWEYPWFAAWDLAFHTLPLALVDPAFAKEQLWMLLFEQFQHPNGQIPAYEWDFSDLNPPVHAWAVWRVFHLERQLTGNTDRVFLERCFHKLLINFAFWINRVDSDGNNIFEGGFLGMDNIALVDRSEPFPNGATLEQADASGWMGMFCLNMMRIALELAKENRAYESMAIKFFQHYAYVASAMKHMGNRDYQLWDDKDGFFYDVLRYPDGRFKKFRARSFVGLIPLFAVERLESVWLDQFPEFQRHMNWFLKNREHLVRDIIHSFPRADGTTLHMLTIVNPEQLVRTCDRIWDEKEFLSPFGIRSLSKIHAEQPFVLQDRSVGYEPAEADCKIKGGNSNWRGPIWFPVNFLLVETFRQLAKASTPNYTVTLKNGSSWTFQGMADELTRRLIALFVPDGLGRRPSQGIHPLFQTDPHWRDHVLFYEYFHGDHGAGLGASHQTGWTGLVATLIHQLTR